MSLLKSPIDYEGLEEELQDAIKADNLYQLQNDAKIRAIEQHVPTYEHFRQMVNGAHLKPLEPKDTNEKVKINWNHFIEYSGKSNNNNLNVNKRYNEHLIINNKQHKQTIIDNNKHCNISKEFTNKWRSFNNKDKFNLLLYMRNTLTEIFAVEIPTNILCEVLAACLSSLPEIDDSRAVIDILTAMTRCNRFQLAVSFMSDQDRLTYGKLFHQLIERNQNSNERNTQIIRIIDLASKYQMNCCINKGKQILYNN